MVTIFSPGECRDNQAEAAESNISLSKQNISPTASEIACSIRDALCKDLHEIENIEWG